MVKIKIPQGLKEAATKLAIEYAIREASKGNSKPLTLITKILGL